MMKQGRMEGHIDGEGIEEERKDNERKDRYKG